VRAALRAVPRVQARTLPEQARGEHERSAAGADLAAAVVEVTHRVRTDSGRLTRNWFERMRASGLAEGPYAEVVGVVALVAGLDYFCRALARRRSSCHPRCRVIRRGTGPPVCARGSHGYPCSRPKTRADRRPISTTPRR